MTSGDEEAVMAVLTAHQHNGDGGGLERRMEVAKAKLESFKESSTLRKVEEFLKAPRLGRSRLVVVDSFMDQGGLGKDIERGG